MLQGTTLYVAVKIMFVKGTGFSPYVLGSQLSWALAPEGTIPQRLKPHL